MLRCMERVQNHLSSANISIHDSKPKNGTSTLIDDPQKIPRVTSEGPDNDDAGKQLRSAETLICMEDFRRLLKIHNRIQAVQCFQYPPNALCCDSKELVREVSIMVYNYRHYCCLSKTGHP